MLNPIILVGLTGKFISSLGLHDHDWISEGHPVSRSHDRNCFVGGVVSRFTTGVALLGSSISRFTTGVSQDSRGLLFRRKALFSSNLMCCLTCSSLTISRLASHADDGTQATIHDATMPHSLTTPRSTTPRLVHHATIHDATTPRLLMTVTIHD